MFICFVVCLGIVVVCLLLLLSLFCCFLGVFTGAFELFFIAYESSSL